MICHFIDTHCYFGFPPFSGGEEVNLQRVAQAGVDKVIAPVTEAENFARVQVLTEKYRPLYIALSLHPDMLEKHSDVPLDQLQQALEKHSARVVVVGEIGLDLLGDDPQFGRQQWLLGEQLKLAKCYDLPVILYLRRTHGKLAMHLKHHDLPYTDVVHGSSGSLQQAGRFAQLGYKIGVGGTITYPRASKTRDAIIKLPLASLLLETDAPDMPLNGLWGQPNRPEQAARMFTVLCELRPEPADEIAGALLNSTYTLFNMPWVGQGVYVASGRWRAMPDTMLTRLIVPTSLCRTVGWMRRSCRIRQLAHNARYDAWRALSCLQICVDPQTISGMPQIQHRKY